MSFQNITPISEVPVAAGASNPPVVIELDDSLDEILIYVTNNGGSTNLVVNVESSPNGIRKAPLHSFNLDTTFRTSHIPVSVVPKYLVFTAINNDNTIPTSYTVDVSKRA